jgi:hypothetical protein
MKIKEIKEETALVEMDFKTLLQVATSLGITIDENNQRSIAQNSAFWKWADMLAKFFNHHGLYVEKIIKMETEWNKDTVKANIFNKVISSLGKKSSTELTKKEIDLFIDVVTKSFAYKGIEIPPFPSKDY